MQVFGDSHHIIIGVRFGNLLSLLFTKARHRGGNSCASCNLAPPAAENVGEFVKSFPAARASDDAPNEPKLNQPGTQVQVKGALEDGLHKRGQGAKLGIQGRRNQVKQNVKQQPYTH